MTGEPSADHPPWRQTLDTVTGPQTLDGLNSCLAALWSEHSEIPDDVRNEVALAAFEICTNIIEHAGRGKPVRMQMKVRLRPTQVDIVFTDDGLPTDVDLNAVVMPPDFADRGRGLALAKASLDDLDYRRSDGKNYWLLSHRVPAG